MLLLSVFLHTVCISGVLSFSRPSFTTPQHIMSVSSSVTKLSTPTATTNNLQRLFLSSDANNEPTQITNINKEEMEEIISHVDNGTGDANYVVIDVRGEPEIMMGTGLMSDKVNILPLPQINMMGAFDMDDKSFEATFNFPKPSVEEDTLVFTCKMGGRSQQAAQLAAMAGYKNIVNYTGGADDWFGGEFVYT